MISAVSGAIAVRDTRVTREYDARDRWRRESETRLDRLADTILEGSNMAMILRVRGGQAAEFAAAQLRLRRALTDAVNPWIEIDVVADVRVDDRKDITENSLTMHSPMLQLPSRVREESSKTHRQHKRELRAR
jgi:hypothetical protein